jgi:apolipoprotein N-acyltransferase
LLFLSFPKFGSGYVAWIALVPLLVALDGQRLWAAARLAYITGLASSVGLLYWTSLVVLQFGGLPLSVAIGVMLLLCTAFSLFHGLFGLFVGYWTERLGRQALLLAPVAWVATEILRSHTLFNFAWCLLGYSQHENLPVLQLARLAAVFGVSFVVCAVNALLAFAWLAPPRTRARALGALAALAALVLAHGAWMLSRPWESSGRLKVGLVQASIPQEEKWAPGQALANVTKHLTLSEQAAQEGARLVVWPESAAPGYYDRSEWLQQTLGDLERRRGIYLLFGNDDREVREGPDRMWVGAKMLTPHGELPYRYHKVRLVPFGEYVPLQSLLTLGGRFSAKMVNQVADFAPGQEYTVGEVDGHRLSAFICYEAIFPDLVREFAVRDAELFVNITNDGWYGTTSAPYQHVSMARFRAVEGGRFLVRAANTGITAVVDPRGRMVASTRLFETTALVHEVDFVKGTTLYARTGDVFAWGCLGAAIALTGSLMARR